MKGLYRVFLVSLWFSIMIGCADDSNTSPEAPPLPDRPTHLSGESWMSYSRDDIINRRLNDIAIPGTHDSGTYGITADSSAADDKKGLSVVMKWIDDMENKWYGPVLDSFGVLQAVDDAGRKSPPGGQERSGMISPPSSSTVSAISTFGYSKGTQAPFTASIPCWGRIWMTSSTASTRSTVSPMPALRFSFWISSTPLTWTITPLWIC